MSLLVAKDFPPLALYVIVYVWDVIAGCQGFPATGLVCHCLCVGCHCWLPRISRHWPCSSLCECGMSVLVAKDFPPLALFVIV